MTRLCVGGSFNPIHYGHLQCAAEVARRRGFDRVVLIPSAQPPHKANDVELASAADRLQMAQLASSQMNENGVHFEVADLELGRSGPSYTFDTAAQLKQWGWEKVSWMIGADMLLYLPKWHRAEELIDAVDFVIVARPGWTLDWSQLPAKFQRLKANVVEVPLVDISATEIRRRVRAGEPIVGLTPPAVIAYIEAKRLYR